MTIACAATDGDRLVMATDQMATGDDGSFFMLPRGKGFVVQGISVACSGGVRMGQMLKDVLDWPKWDKETENLETYLSKWVVPAFQALLRDLAPDFNEDYEILVAVPGEICAVYSDGSVLPCGPFGAIGSGRDYAKAVLSMADNPLDAVEQAIDMACELSAYCRGGVMWEVP